MMQSCQQNGYHVASIEFDGYPEFPECGWKHKMAAKPTTSTTNTNHLWKFSSGQPGSEGSDWRSLRLAVCIPGVVNSSETRCWSWLVPNYDGYQNLEAPNTMAILLLHTSSFPKSKMKPADTEKLLDRAQRLGPMLIRCSGRHMVKSGIAS